MHYGQRQVGQGDVIKRGGGGEMGGGGGRGEDVGQYLVTAVTKSHCQLSPPAPIDSHRVDCFVNCQILHGVHVVRIS